MAPTNGGVIIGTSSKPLSRVLPRKLKRVIQCASGSVRNVVSSVVRRPMAKLLKMDWRCSGLSSSRKKYFRPNASLVKNAPFNMKLTG